jgi:predicted Na+-dependent transporter
MELRRKVTLQIATTWIISVLLIAFVIFKMPNHAGWDTSIVILTFFVDIIIMHRAREARKSAER